MKHDDLAEIVAYYEANGIELWHTEDYRKIHQIARLALDRGKEIERLKGEIAAHCTAYLEDWRTDRDQLRQAVEERNQTIRLNEKKIERLEMENTMLKKSRDLVQGFNERMLTQHLPDRDAQIEHLEKQVARLEVQVESLQEQNDDLKDQIKGLFQDLAGEDL